MLSEFGKEVRMLRLDAGVRLKDMAEALKVTSAFLSAVEVGRKNASTKLVNSVCDYFSLTDEACTRLHGIVNAAREEVTIPLGGVTQKHGELATAFARQFSEMSEDSADQLLNFLKSKHVKR